MMRKTITSMAMTTFLPIRSCFWAKRSCIAGRTLGILLVIDLGILMWLITLLGKYWESQTMSNSSPWSTVLSIHPKRWTMWLVWIVVKIFCFGPQSLVFSMGPFQWRLHTLSCKIVLFELKAWCLKILRQLLWSMTRASLWIFTKTATSRLSCKLSLSIQKTLASTLIIVKNYSSIKRNRLMWPECKFKITPCTWF